MSVIVKGMEMPNCCAECELCKHEKWNDENIYRCNAKLITFGEFDTWIFKKRPDWCPLHPLPEKHGRLIDADDMERFMSDTVQGDIRQYPYSDTLWGQ